MAGNKTAASEGAGTVAKSLVDKALKARWEQAIARYRAARDTESSGWDDRYEALGDIIESEPPYYLAGGHATTRAFLKAEASVRPAPSLRE